MSDPAIRYRIRPQVFELFPEYVRGVVLAFDVKNGQSPPELVARLRQTEADLLGLIDSNAISEHPRFVSWREAYRAIGAKPSKFRPSMEAMARRVLKGQEIPSINALVDIGNIVSLSHLVPAGGHAVDVLTQDIELRPAVGDEQFVPFGEDSMEHPVPGEVIFVEGRTVLTRRWTWRQAQHTIMKPDSTAVEFNVDGLPPVPQSEIEAACKELIDLIQQFCGGTKFRYEILSSGNPEMRIR